jgi:hypothetical protein
LLENPHPKSLSLRARDLRAIPLFFSVTPVTKFAWRGFQNNLFFFTPLALRERGWG